MRRRLSSVVLVWVVAAAQPPAPVHASGYDEELARIGAELAQCMAQSGRKRVAAVDFTDLQMNVSELGRLIAEELTTELVRQAPQPGYAVIDRNHLQLILREHELSANGLVNPENSRKLGQFAGIDTLITGNVFELEESIRVTVKAMDTESASIACASRGDLPKTMALREIAATTTRGASSATAASTAPREGGPSQTPPGYINEYLRATLDAITKTRDGRRVQITLRVKNVGDTDFLVALHADDPPTLTDNVGSEWQFVRCSGIDKRTQNTNDFWGTDRLPQTDFPRNGELVISCTFAGENSPGTRFHFTSSLAARRYDSTDVFFVSIGLSDLQTP